MNFLGIELTVLLLIYNCSNSLASRNEQHPDAKSSVAASRKRPLIASDPQSQGEAADLLRNMDSSYAPETSQAQHLKEKGKQIMESSKNDEVSNLDQALSELNYYITGIKFAIAKIKFKSYKEIIKLDLEIEYEYFARSEKLIEKIITDHPKLMALKNYVKRNEMLHVISVYIKNGKKTFEEIKSNSNNISFIRKNLRNLDDFDKMIVRIIQIIHEISNDIPRKSAKNVRKFPYDEVIEKLGRKLTAEKMRADLNKETILSGDETPDDINRLRLLDYCMTKLNCILSSMDVLISRLAFTSRSKNLQNYADTSNTITIGISKCKNTLMDLESAKEGFKIYSRQNDLLYIYSCLSKIEFIFGNCKTYLHDSSLIQENILELYSIESLIRKMFSCIFNVKSDIPYGIPPIKKDPSHTKSKNPQHESAEDLKRSTDPRKKSANEEVDLDLHLGRDWSKTEKYAKLKGKSSDFSGNIAESSKYQGIHGESNQGLVLTNTAVEPSNNKDQPSRKSSNDSRRSPSSNEKTSISSEKKMKTREPKGSSSSR